jgi:hypothetical protein
LHEESRDNLTTTVKTVLTGRDLTCTDGVLHGLKTELDELLYLILYCTYGGCGHGVFTTDTNGIEEERPSVADYPSIERGSPGSSEHDETDKHDDGVLNETPSATNGVTDDTDQDLTADDTDDFEICESLCPGLVALGVFGPATGVCSGKQGCDVANGEQNVTGRLGSARCPLFIDRCTRISYPSRRRPAPGMTAFLIYQPIGLRGSFFIMRPMFVSSLFDS